MQSTAITLTFWHSLQSQHQLFCHQFLAVAEDFVKSVAVEKHPTTKNTHYYEGQFTEGDSEVPWTPPFHVEPLKRAINVKTPSSPHITHM